MSLDGIGESKTRSGFGGASFFIASDYLLVVDIRRIKTRLFRATCDLDPIQPNRVAIK
jgi:hypothetical protein